MKAYLFNDVQVEIDPRAAQIGGSWQGVRRNGLPTAWDGDLLHFFYERMRPGCHFLDIGSSTGSYCLLCALRLDCTCMAFEPNPAAREILQANVRLNNLDDRVKVSSYALWDSNGQETLRLPDDEAAGLACLAVAPTRFRPVHSIQVETRRLDSLDTNRVDLIKIDVEGAELFVLRGAVETLTRDHPGLLLEFDERNTAAFGYEPAAIIELLRDLNYKYFEFPTTDKKDLWATV